MSTISNFMLANLAERLTPLLQTPVEDIVYEILDRKGLPTRSEIRDLKNRLERIDEEVKKLNEQLSRLRETAAKPAAAPAVKPEKKPAKKPAKPAAKAKKAEPAPKAAAAPAKRRGRPPRQGPPPICTVGGCDLHVRSKGFCAKHYQSWRRGRLQGFVDPNGMLPLDTKGTAVKVDKRYAAEPASCKASGGQLLISVKGRELKRKASPTPAKKRRTAKKK